jgi:mannose-6-phosphate isomerase-like protein (cupin superfamily)
MFAMALMGGKVMGQNQATKMETQTASADKSGVKYFSNAELMASFAKGGTIANEGNYKVMTAHRTEGGNVELHRNFTDIFYIVQGSTTLVTGGKMIGETDKNPDEPRGTSIEGGETRKLSAGDAIVIPAGVPHWMKDVEGTLLYFVVKVENPSK